MGLFLNDVTTCGDWTADPAHADQIRHKGGAGVPASTSCVQVGVLNPGIGVDVAVRCEERCVGRRRRGPGWEPTLREEVAEATEDATVNLAVATRDTAVSALQWAGIYRGYQASKAKLDEADAATADMPPGSKARRAIASLRAREARIDAAIAGAPGVSGGLGTWQVVAAGAGVVTLAGGLGYAIHRFSQDVIARWVCTRSLDKVPPADRVAFMDTCQPAGTPWYMDLRVLGIVGGVAIGGWFLLKRSPQGRALLGGGR